MESGGKQVKTENSVTEDHTTASIAMHNSLQLHEEGH